MGSTHSGREDIQPAEQEQRPRGGVDGVRGEGGRGWVWTVVPWRGERVGQVCYTSEEVRLDRLVSELADCVAGPPCLARCGSVRTGRPLAWKGEVLGGQGLSLWIDLRVSRGKAWGGAAR